MYFKANTLSKQELLAKLEAETFERIPVSFYRYVMIDSVEAFRNALYDEWSQLGVLGRVYVAREGINAQVSVPAPQMEAFRVAVDMHRELKDVPFKIGLRQDGVAFWKLVIKAREYILADGLDHGSYDVTNVGSHLSAKEFNEAIEGGAVVVDMRNNFESDIGHFEGALCPNADTFREELPVVLETLQGKEEEKILLYCTGGIRCEKTSAFLKHHGFKDVNQLHGGIIDYKHQIDAEELSSKYKGLNYVFDGREAEVITEDVLGVCYQCKRSANTTVNCSNQVCHVLFIQCPDCQEHMNGACSEGCKEITLLPEEEQKQRRKGVKYTGRLVLR
ncbi:hypothetical protein CO174_00775 [Candidatus Uhrbacteria bacterium CG_4_9_14_3_um_filter_50_9]|uniref:tRNA uridine(34) hydroxylase n=1 Tax=Candidatus Uhrbacteria bacterium CG_4_9_14_3_um_filter_50_9 TaxID=1975035 RepID=A0A2M7XE50_9BACT|nr:MAG: hypothetical protein CO174_00775 [Candidatus Uhrbacteria bacterium CG_4_9_14_3_um_filter_50_9]